MNTETVDLDDIPEALLVKNRKPLTPAQQHEVETVMATAKRASRANARRAAHSKPAAKSKEGPKRRADGLIAGSGGARLVDFVCRKEGATNAELCAMIGWKQCLPFLKKSCEQAGVKLRTEKAEGELTRYFGMRKKAKGA